MTPPGNTSSSTAAVSDIAAPLYGATVGQAFTRFWRKYLVISGRASRSELWWMALLGFLVEALLILLDLALSGGDANAAFDFSGPGGTVSLALTVITLIPTVTLQTRRLHDTGRSGWWQLIVLIPLAGVIALVVLLASPTDLRASKFADEVR